MKDDFNFEQALGLLEQAFQNGDDYKAFDLLQKLARHPEQKDIIPVIETAIDYLAENTDIRSSLSYLVTTAGNLRTPKSVAEKVLQEALVQKWKDIVEGEIASNPANALQYLTGANTYITGINTNVGDYADHPLRSLMLSTWESFSENAAVKDAFYKLAATTLEENNIKTPEFRFIILKKLATYAAEDPDWILDTLNNLVSKNTVFINFRREDTASAELLVRTMVDILKDRASLYKPEKAVEVAHAILVRGKAFIDETEVNSIARIYLDAARRVEIMDPVGGFRWYSDLVVGPENTQMPAVIVAEAKEKILDLAEAGRLEKTRNLFGNESITNFIVKYILPVKAFTDRAADIVLRMVCADLQQKEKLKSDGYPFTYNNALALIAALPANDPRNAEIIARYKESITENYKKNDIQRYIFQMEDLLKIAASKSDDALTHYAEAEWRDSVKLWSAQNPRQAFVDVQSTFNQAAEGTLIRAAAASLLPELEKRAGMQGEAKPLNSGDFLKRFGGPKKNKKAPGPL